MRNGLYQRDNGSFQVFLATHDKGYYIGTYDTRKFAQGAFKLAKLMFCNTGLGLYEDSLKDSQGKFLPYDEVTNRMELGWL